MRKTTVIGFLGSTLDAIVAETRRWERWRPSVAIVMQNDLRVDRFILLHGRKHTKLARFVANDIQSVSPETTVELRLLDFCNPWDFEEVYGKLLDFAQAETFDPEAEDYLIHISTGTHVAQICLFLLTEARFLPGKLLQSNPVADRKDPVGKWNCIDLDLSRYDSIATRFAAKTQRNASFLKSGIETRNAAFNRMIDEIEQVAARSKAPILLMGPTGAGKSHLARKIYELKRLAHQVPGPFAEVNCATLKGDSAMSALFGHRKGAFTGAVADRPGLLRSADQGILFLDEIGELGADEQAMILRAIEDKCFLPVGSDKEVTSSFQLIAGTNRDLRCEVMAGTFREDLFARLNLWTFTLPSLAERREDLEPNLDYELDRFAEREGNRVGFNKEARQRYISFATGPEATWAGNFRDLAASVTRMATLAPQGRINGACVDLEISRLTHLWGSRAGADSRSLGDDGRLTDLLGAEALSQIDLFDRVQLAEVVAVCSRCRTLSEAGRILFAASKQRRVSTNDADRLRKYLARFGLDWAAVKG